MGGRLGCLGEEHCGEGGGCFAFPPVKTRCSLLVILAPAIWRCFPKTGRANPHPEDRLADRLGRSRPAIIPALWGKKLCAPIPHQALPRLCSWHQVVALAVTDCSHPKETQPGLRRIRTFLGLVELQVQFPSPTPSNGVQKTHKPPQKSIISQLLKLYGMRRGRDTEQSPGGSIHATYRVSKAFTAMAAEGSTLHRQFHMHIHNFNLMPTTLTTKYCRK